MDRNPSFEGFNDATLAGCNVLEKKKQESAGHVLVSDESIF